VSGKAYAQQRRALPRESWSVAANLSRSNGVMVLTGLETWRHQHPAHPVSSILLLHLQVAPSGGSCFT
jgi:hypothetical protein